MHDDTHTYFGLLIAYVLPGLLALLGISCISPLLRDWLGSTSASTATVGGFLYIALAAVGAGLTVSTVRWFFLDALHHLTGLKHPQWELSRLGERVEAFKLMIEIHYRYYQFYGNSLVAVLLAYGCWRTSTPTVESAVGLVELPVASLAAMFFVASRDTLRNYYARVEGILSDRTFRDV